MLIPLRLLMQVLILLRQLMHLQLQIHFLLPQLEILHSKVFKRHRQLIQLVLLPQSLLRQSIYNEFIAVDRFLELDTILRPLDRLIRVLQLFYLVKEVFVLFF